MKKRVVLICVSIIYSLFLIFVLFLKGNRGILSNATFTEYISAMCNFIPFATITEYIKAISNHSMNIIIPIENVGGNFILFMPFAVIMYISTRMKEWKFLLILFGLLFIIEVAQLLTRLGSFDIDDFILNMTGAAFAYWLASLIHKKNSVKQNRKWFKNDRR